MQYFKPEGDFYVGDCMPFFHDGLFHLFYLVDENHHQALGGLGGHQWAHASSTDLINWTHHPMAIPISDELEGSICTGSVSFHEGKYYAFYATRLRDWKQHVSLAVSDDCIKFTKIDPKLFYSPPSNYNPNHFRDPVVFLEKKNKIFHMLVTAELNEYPVTGRGGCLAHLTSNHLEEWKIQEPFIIPGFPDVPECPDYFFWNGWYYLIFSNFGKARYRMSRKPLGPWLRPVSDQLDGGASCVMKTAAFHNNRRISVSWIGTRKEEKDYGHHQFGGYTVFRELIQHDDGTLGTKFVNEMNPSGKTINPLEPIPITSKTKCDTQSILFAESNGLGAAVIKNIPLNFHLKTFAVIVDGNGVFGMRLRSRDTIDTGYDLCFDFPNKTVKLHTNSITQVNLEKFFWIEIIAKDSIIDVCIGNNRCIIDYCPEQNGENIWFYGWDKNVAFQEIVITKL